jgi:hypothetical protein
LKKLWSDAAEWSDQRRDCPVFRVPPSPPPFERLAGRGVRKKCLQNLEGRGVRGQNPENKRVKAVVVSLAYTAFASVMMS